MKDSEQHKQDAKNTLVAGIIFTVTSLMILGLMIATKEIVPILLGLGLLCFAVVISTAEYWDYRDIQKKAEEVEAQEEAERQRQMLKS